MLDAIAAVARHITHRGTGSLCPSVHAHLGRCVWREGARRRAKNGECEACMGAATQPYHSSSFLFFFFPFSLVCFHCVKRASACPVFPGSWAGGGEGTGTVRKLTTRLPRLESAPRDNAIYTRVIFDVSLIFFPCPSYARGYWHGRNHRTWVDQPSPFPGVNACASLKPKRSWLTFEPQICSGNKVQDGEVELHKT